MLVLTRKSHEKIQIGPNITVTILRVKGGAVRVGIEAPRDVSVLRAELETKPAREGGRKVEIGAASEPAPKAMTRRRMAETVSPTFSGGKTTAFTASPALNPLRSRLPRVATAPLTSYLARR